MNLLMWRAPLQPMLRANSQSRANLPAQASQLALREKGSDFAS
jgi:hypothetical protein